MSIIAGNASKAGNATVVPVLGVLLVMLVLLVVLVILVRQTIYSGDAGIAGKAGLVHWKVSLYRGVHYSYMYIGGSTAMLFMCVNMHVEATSTESL